MKRIDGYDIYSLGKNLHRIQDLNGTTTYADALVVLLRAEVPLDAFLHRSAYRITHSMKSGKQLLDAIKLMQKKIVQTSEKLTEKNISSHEAFSIRGLLEKFDNNISAEFYQLPNYFVSKKGGYDTSDLIENGTSLFQYELKLKVPEAIYDIEQATKCIAFEVPTAAAFHLHRANESVLRRYFESQRGESKAPKSKNMGEYLKIMNERNIGDDKVISALTNLKNLHRNPIAHPDTSIDSIEEAIDLLGAIRASIGYMIKDLPMLSDSKSSGLGALSQTRSGALQVLESMPHSAADLPNSLGPKTEQAEHELPSSELANRHES
jgi:hypothetical protein